MIDTVTPTQTHSLLDHFKRMQVACANYIEPTTYIARHPESAKIGDCKHVREFNLPNEHHTASAAHEIEWRRDRAFISDIIYMLDGPEQRAAEAAEATQAAEIARLQEYEALFTALRDQSWDLRCFSIPTGGDDADIGWRVIGHWMAEPTERTIAEVYTDSPAAAVRAALSAQPSEHVLPNDVVRLVIAARTIAFGDWCCEGEDYKVARKELDDAAEAFASRVEWPDTPSEQEGGE